MLLRVAALSFPTSFRPAYIVVCVTGERGNVTLTQSVSAREFRLCHGRERTRYAPRDLAAPSSFPSTLPYPASLPPARSLSLSSCPGSGDAVYSSMKSRSPSFPSCLSFIVLSCCTPRRFIGFDSLSLSSSFALFFPRSFFLSFPFSFPLFSLFPFYFLLFSSISSLFLSPPFLSLTLFSLLPPFFLLSFPFPSYPLFLVPLSLPLPAPPRLHLHISHVSRDVRCARGKKKISNLRAH